VITGIIDGAVFYTTQSRLQIFVSYFVKDLIVKTTANYTEFNLQTLLKLKGIYAKRIYMQLCRFNQTGTYQISMMDFLNQMGLGGKYQRIYDLKKRVLNPAIDLINEHSEYNVMVNAQGDYFIFGFRLKQAADNNFIPELYDRLIALGLADWQAKQAMSTMTAIQIKYVLQRYYQALANAHTIHNPGAYIWQALCADGCPKNKVNIQLSITDE
jgi:plasmid replication initiation protein